MTQPTTYSDPMDDPVIRTQAITLLLAAAETNPEFNALHRVALRAGFLRRCPNCREEQYLTRETCCGKPLSD